MSLGIQVGRRLAARAAEAVRRAADHLLSRQTGDGYWQGLLTADTTLESDYILLQLWLHPPEGRAWNPPSRPQVDKAVRSILDRELPGGGFSLFPKGPPDVSASVKAYFALKLAGFSPDGPELSRLRECILSLGGLQAANSYVKINLSMFGLYPREHCPSVPPEMILLPGKFVYRMSSWTRAIVIPLSIIHAHSPARPVPAGFDLKEIFLPGAPMEFRNGLPLGWRKAFLWLDVLLKFWDRHGSKSLRRIAIREAEHWMLERTRYSDGLAAIYPPMLYAIMALDLLGYPPCHPDRAEAQRQFDRLMVDNGESILFQPCFSPVWDTAIAAHALGEAGIAPDERLRKAADWLLTKEVRRKGDWSVMRPRTEPSGWYFEFANEFYPDIDDTAMVLLALSHARASDAEAHSAAVRRAVAWLLDMQSRDGGWAAFDVDNNWSPLGEVPFADHNAMLDPSCPDITGRVLEALCASGLDGRYPAVRRGVSYLRSVQEQDGSWYGRWGVNYIYGTYLALRGLRAAGGSDREAHVLRAAEWLRSIQNADGGWGESCASYDNGFYTPAESTASQTSWAILGLLAGGDAGSRSVIKGIDYLLDTQRSDGSWDEELATGTGFPRVFYLNYHLYRQSFPLAALASFLKANAVREGEGDEMR